MSPRFFKTQEHFRRWLDKNHASATEVWIGMYRKVSGKGGLTYRQALDEALCFGWIDGVRFRLDEASYTIRFTPRRRGSRWSTVNTRRMDELIAAGRVRRAGLAAFERRDPAKSGTYSYEQRHGAELGPDRERRFRANAAAWTYFQAQPPWYRRTATWWVVSAKREETRARRLETLIERSARGEPIRELERPAKPSAKAKRSPKPRPS